MKTLAVVSDSHGNRAVFEKLARIFEESDYIIHLGDTSADGNVIRKQYPEKTYVLNGNCDGISPCGEDEIVLKVENLTVLLAHGHRYGVKYRLDDYAARAESVGAGLALYGHTHKAREDKVGDVTLFNPGNLTRYGNNSYGYVVVNGDKAVCKIVELD